MTRAGGIRAGRGRECRALQSQLNDEGVPWT